MAVVGAALALLITYWTKPDRVSDILRDVDWESLLFFVCIFVLVDALDKTGVIGGLGTGMGALFGKNVILASLLLLVGIGVLLSVIPKHRARGGDVPLVKQYAMGAGLATPAAPEAGYGHMPPGVAVMFFAMCFGATLGGNASLLGASSNIVAGGICARAGRPISFVRFLRYGIPVTVVEDEVVTRLAMAKSLRDGGYQVVEAGDGDEARAVLRAGTTVDLIFSDVQLPGEGDGFELARWVRDRCPAIPVILTSGIPGVAQKARCEGHDGPVVPKPYSHEEVVQLVQERLCSASGRRSGA